jgi:hypothetical protein
VTRDKGEMSFAKFDFPKQVDNIIAADPKSTATLKAIQQIIGKHALPTFLIDFIESSQNVAPDSLAIHTSSSIAGYGDTADKQAIARPKGFMGKPQLEEAKFPNASHHVKIFYNEASKARLFYKVSGGVEFMANKKPKAGDKAN